MNTPPANNAIDQAEKIITDIFENGKHDKDAGEKLYRVMTLLADVRAAINHDTEDNGEVCDSVSGAMVCINRIRVTASRYSDARFTEDDEENEDFIMFGLLITLASEAYCRLKLAETELFK